jgi:hypothetical protein
MSEKTDRRYNFNAFVFGRDGDVNLVIETATGDFGYLTQYALELTPEERQELITILLTTKRVGEQD